MTYQHCDLTTFSVAQKTIFLLKNKSNIIKFQVKSMKNPFIHETYVKKRKVRQIIV